jgi:hypothetical protein
VFVQLPSLRERVHLEWEAMQISGRILDEIRMKRNGLRISVLQKAVVMVRVSRWNKEEKDMLDSSIVDG